MEEDRSNYHTVKRYASHRISYNKMMRNKFGERYVHYRKNWEDAGAGKLITRFPLQIEIDPVDSCNLQCVHCQELYTRKRTHKKIPKEYIDAIFSESTTCGLCALNIGATSEPLLDKNMVFYILDLAKKANVMEIFMHTNGLLLDENTSQKILESNVTHLCISVDALDKRTYAKIRGGNFCTLIKNIHTFVALKKKMKKALPLLRLSFLIQKENYSQKERFMRKWAPVADIIDFQPLINYHYFKEAKGGKLPQCFNPFLRVMVGTSGEIGGCCCGIGFNKDVLLGRYPKTAIYDAWNSKKAQQFRNAMLSSELSQFPTCYDCLRRR